VLCGLRRARLVLVHVSCCGAILCLLSRQLCCCRSIANMSVHTEPNSIARFQNNFSAVLPSATLFRDVVRVTAVSALHVAVKNIFFSLGPTLAKFLVGCALGLLASTETSSTESLHQRAPRRLIRPWPLRLISLSTSDCRCLSD